MQQRENLKCKMQQGLRLKTKANVLKLTTYEMNFLPVALCAKARPDLNSKLSKPRFLALAYSSPSWPLVGLGQPLLPLLVFISICCAPTLLRCTLTYYPSHLGCDSWGGKDAQRANQLKQTTANRGNLRCGP